MIAHFFLFFFHSSKMDYNNMKVVDLKALVKEHGLRGYSNLKKAELITFLQNIIFKFLASGLKLHAPGHQDQLGLLPHLHNWLGLDQYKM